MRQSLLIAGLILFIHLGVFNKAAAVPAYPKPIEYRQPDGTVVTMQLKGDEKVRWAETIDGYTLLRNKKVVG
jgi:hypothetical protein